MFVNCPGVMNPIVPPQMHISFEELLRAGAPQSNTVGAPGTQGAGVAGTQGIGVRTPNAAAVAAATVGLARLVHMPKGMMLSIGTWSSMLAATMLLVSTGFGVGISELGASPIVQFIMAPMQVCIAIARFPFN